MNNGKRIVIVGGVAGGASAAARMRRLDERASIVLFERGAEISFANCGMPYHVGGVISQRQKLLVQTAAAFGKRFNVQVRARTEVVKIDRQAKTVTAVDLNTGAPLVEPYDALVLSPGAEPIRPPLPGIDSKRVMTLRSMADMDAIKLVVDGTQPGAAVPQGAARPSSAVVVGGGYIGLEMVEALRGRGLSVSLVELAPQVFSAVDPEMATPIHQHLQAQGVTLYLGQGVQAFEEVPEGVARASRPCEVDEKQGQDAPDTRGRDALDTRGQDVRDTRGGPLTVRLAGGEALPCDLAILAIGVRPEVRLAREAGLEIGPTGGIAVDAHMRTSDPSIYAVGDASEVRNFVTNQPALVPLAGPANRQGRIAADNIAGRDSVYRNTQGTAICKIFELSVGMTGLSEKALQKSGLAYEKVYVYPASHASYYPGASPISLKLLFEPTGGKILGAQAVGTDGVDKRIDVLAVAMRAGMTVFDLEDLELSYAPPYGSAKDVVNYAGFVAANALRGDVKVWHCERDAGILPACPEGVSPSVLPGEEGGKQRRNVEDADKSKIRRGEMSAAPSDAGKMPATHADGTSASRKMLLDVRTPAEVEAGTIPGATVIPLDDLRSRLGELPRDKELLVYCQVGLRGYLACRILSQNGFACRNLSGGYKTYCAVTNAHTPACVAAANVCAAPAPTATRPAANAAGSCGCSAPTDDAGSRMAPASGAVAIDATGLQCPGPIMKLKEAIAKLQDGQSLTILASDVAFAADVKGWCHSTGNELQNLDASGKTIRATILKRSPSSAPARSPAEAKTMNGKTIIVFSNDLDKVMASFIIANGAATMGGPVTMFFTFWGLNVLRRRESVAVPKTLIERMFGWMMPRGAGKLTLSKMHMGGMGTAMMKGVMARKNVAPLPELIASARAAGVRLVACSMSMDVMGIHKEELIDGVELGGVAMYLDQAEQGNVNLFI